MKDDAARRMRRGLATALVSATAAAPAQTSPPRELPEVVVTSQKQPQTLQQVPASVSAIDSELIRATGARDIADLAAYSGNTQIQLSPSAAQLIIRGFGTVNSNPGFDPSVGAVVDGVYYSYSNYLAAFFNDIARFETLRGPQGTLFGKNCTAGLVSITTEAPGRTRMLRWETLMTSYGAMSFRPAADLPLSDTLGLRVSGNLDHGDRGVLYNTDLDRHENAPNQDTGRMRLRYDDHAGLIVDMGAFLSSQRQNFNLYQYTQVSPQMLALDQLYDPRTEGAINDLTSANVPATESALLRGVSLNTDYDLSRSSGLRSLHLVSITGAAENIIGARDLDGDFSPVPFIRDTLAEPAAERQLSEELRVQGSSDTLFGWGHSFNFVAGLYYDNYTLKTSDLFQIEDLGAALAYVTAGAAGANGNGRLPPGTVGRIAGRLGATVDQLLALLAPSNPLAGPQNAQVKLSQRTRNYAAFGQFEQFFLPHWAIIGGLRYGKENRSGEASSLATGPLVPLIAGQQDFDQKLERTESDLSPKAGLKWQPKKTLGAYLTWSRGYKSGGFNGLPLSPQDLEYEPERATNYETGIKYSGRLFGGPIRASTSAFVTEFKNLQVSTYQGTSIVVLNAAAARSQGFEGDVLWLLPLKGLSFYSSFGLADARYTSYPDAPVAADSPQPSQDLGGMRLPFAPRWSASMVPSYTLALPRNAEASLAMDLLYQGERYLNPEDDPRELQPATLVVNTRLSLSDAASGAWTLTLAAQNLTKEVILDQIEDQPLAPGNFAGIRSDRGRYYTANLRLVF